MSPASRSASAMSRMTRARPSIGPGGNRQADQRAGRHVVASVRPGDGLAVRREHPGRRERLIRPERVLALADELVIHLVRAHDVVELLEREVEDVFLLAKHVGLHEALGFFQQGLLVDEVAADHAVLRILPVPDEGPDPVDHPLGLFGLPLPVRQGPQALQHLLLLLPGLLPPLLEAPLAGARLEVLDVAEDHGHERGGAFAPARPRDVDLADAAHAVHVEQGLDGVPRFPPDLRAWAARPGSPRPRRAAGTPPRPDAGGSRPRRPGAPAPSPT